MKTLSQHDLNGLNELFNNFNVKNIFDELGYLVKSNGDGMPIALSLLDMIIENSNDFTKDVAKKGNLSEDNNTLSYKQKWALAYQIKNNLEVYLLAVKEYSLFKDEKEVIENSNEVNYILENEAISIVDNFKEVTDLVDNHFKDFKDKATEKVECSFESYQISEGELYQFYPPKGVSGECFYSLVKNKSHNFL